MEARTICTIGGGELTVEPAGPPPAAVELTAVRNELWRPDRIVETLSRISAEQLLQALLEHRPLQVPTFTGALLLTWRDSVIFLELGAWEGAPLQVCRFSEDDDVLLAGAIGEALGEGGRPCGHEPLQAYEDRAA